LNLHRLPDCRHECVLLDSAVFILPLTGERERRNKISQRRYGQQRVYASRFRTEITRSFYLVTSRAVAPNSETCPLYRRCHKAESRGANVDVHDRLLNLRHVTRNTVTTLASNLVMLCLDLSMVRAPPLDLSPRQSKNILAGNFVRVHQARAVPALDPDDGISICRTKHL
jgi:hypothetical protein